VSEEARKELGTLAARIREWQKCHADKDGKPYTVTSFLRDYPALGSDRVYNRICADDLEDLDVDRWARDYGAVWALLQMQDECADRNDPVYDDLTVVIDLRKAVARVMRENGINRLVVMQMPQGCGKTTAAKLTAARFGARVVFAEATEIWRENPNAMLQGLLLALGVAEASVPVSASGKWLELGKRLNERRVCLMIDEAHQLGLRTLNLVKSLINQTPGEIVLLAMDTLWRRLETAAYEEARQLTQNRLMERIRAEGANASDVALIIERRLGMKNGDAMKAAKAICEKGNRQGHLTFANLVCREAKERAKGQEVTLEMVANAVTRVAGMR
jgi:type II secretory pathway predicted ATPase ExeA